MAELKRATGPREDETTRTTAHLPGLDITILHRQSPDEGSEEISINLRALPSFAAFGDAIGTLNPFAFWIEASRLAWTPWLAATHMLFGAGHTPLLAQDPRQDGER